jgi:hypothetical protein
MATKKVASKTKKAVSASKKTTAAKTVKKTVKKPAAKVVKKGARYACDVCGLAVTVDSVCGCVDSCDLICCGEQMRSKK